MTRDRERTQKSKWGSLLLCKSQIGEERQRTSAGLTFVLKEKGGKGSVFDDGEVCAECSFLFFCYLYFRNESLCVCEIC